MKMPKFKKMFSKKTKKAPTIASKKQVEKLAKKGLQEYSNVIAELAKR